MQLFLRNGNKSSTVNNICKLLSLKVISLMGNRDSNTLNRDFEHGIQLYSIKSQPFTTLMWVENPDGVNEKFGIKVQIIF